MSVASYEFDPSSIDGSNESEEGNDYEFTLDSWEPTKKEKCAPKSQWRQAQNNGNNNQQPGIDELKKIHMFLKRKYPDYQIMNSFGISCETLSAIKSGHYSPVDGISLDNLSKIHKEFARIDKRIEKIADALRLILDNAVGFEDITTRNAFKKLIGKCKAPNNNKDEEE